MSYARRLVDRPDIGSRSGADRGEQSKATAMSGARFGMSWNLRMGSGLRASPRRVEWMADNGSAVLIRLPDRVDKPTKARRLHVERRQRPRRPGRPHAPRRPAGLPGLRARPALVRRCPLRRCVHGLGRSSVVPQHDEPVLPRYAHRAPTRRVAPLPFCATESVTAPAKPRLLLA